MRSGEGEGVGREGEGREGIGKQIECYFSYSTKLLDVQLSLPYLLSLFIATSSKGSCLASVASRRFRW